MTFHGNYLIDGDDGSNPKSPHYCGDDKPTCQWCDNNENSWLIPGRFKWSGHEICYIGFKCIGEVCESCLESIYGEIEDRAYEWNDSLYRDGVKIKYNNGSRQK